MQSLFKLSWVTKPIKRKNMAALHLKLFVYKTIIKQDLQFTKQLQKRMLKQNMFQIPFREKRKFYFVSSKSDMSFQGICNHTSVLSFQVWAPWQQDDCSLMYSLKKNNIASERTLYVIVEIMNLCHREDRFKAQHVSHSLKYLCKTNF